MSWACIQGLGGSEAGVLGGAGLCLWHREEQNNRTKVKEERETAEENHGDVYGGRR